MGRSKMVLATLILALGAWGVERVQAQEEGPKLPEFLEKIQKGAYSLNQAGVKRVLATLTWKTSEEYQFDDREPANLQGLVFDVCIRSNQWGDYVQTVARMRKIPEGLHIDETQGIEGHASSVLYTLFLSPLQEFQTYLQQPGVSLTADPETKLATLTFSEDSGWGLVSAACKVSADDTELEMSTVWRDGPTQTKTYKLRWKESKYVVSSESTPGDQWSPPATKEITYGEKDGVPVVSKYKETHAFSKREMGPDQVREFELTDHKVQKK